MARIKDEGFYKRLVISRDDYIVDGHHTWAGQLALDAKDNNLEDDERSVKIARVDIPILKLVEEAEKFTGGKGKKPASEAPKGFTQITMAEASTLLPSEAFARYFGAACEFFAANAHIELDINDLTVVVRDYELKRDASSSLYVRRDLQNVQAFTAWAEAQGFAEVSDELHVTVLYSKTAVDWAEMGRDARGLVVAPGGVRGLEQLGDEGAVTLHFESAKLAERHDEMVEAGGSHDYDSYIPHVTINLLGTIPDNATPYMGELVFGPEIFEKIDKTKEFDEDKHPRVPAGSPGGGEFTSGGGGETSPEGTSENFDPKVVEVGGDAWNRATARRLEREYQTAKPALDKITNNAVKDAELEDELSGGGKPKAEPKPWDELTPQEQDSVYVAWRAEHGEDFKNNVEAAEFWAKLTDEQRTNIAADMLSEDVEPDEEEEEEEEEPPYIPEEWDMLSGDQQTETEEMWKKDNYDSVHSSEVDNWYSNGGALDDAKNKVAWDYTKDLDSDGGEWAMDALNDLADERAEGDAKPLPFSHVALLRNIKITYEGNGEGSDDPDIEIDDAGLDKEGAAGIDPAQQQLPGFDPVKPSELLTEDMRDEITSTLTKAFNKKAEDIQGSMDAPEYLGESVDEYLDQMWGELDDSDKFKYADDHDIFEKPDEKPSASAPAAKPTNPWRVDALPETYDPLNETAGADYVRTQHLARYLSIMRARELIKDRGLRETYPPKERVAAVDNKLWSEWKGSSTSQDGQLLQVATAEELGGRLNAKTATGIDTDSLKSYAEHRYADIGGYKGVLAYVRAKWETTQFLLDKAKQNELELYRGIDLGRYDSARYEQAVAEKGVRQLVTVDRPEYKGAKFEKAPTIKIDRNGAASTTTDIKVANGWMEGGKGKITLRAVVPRTAAISIPAYGINVHGEHEVVVAGTAWKAWDAWIGRAPTFEQVPIGPKGSGIGISAQAA